MIPWHLSNDDLAIRKLCVSEMENNVYVLACRRTSEALIVDAADEAGRILAAVADLEPVGVLTTHSHWDHLRALDEVTEDLAVPSYVHPLDRPAGRDSQALVEDGQQIGLGDLDVTVLHTPGHTPGSICLQVNGCLFTGDTLFPGGPGATAGAREFETIVDSISSHLLDLPDSTLVLPGHGLDTTIGAERALLESLRQANGGP